MSNFIPPNPRNLCAGLSISLFSVGLISMGLGAFPASALDYGQPVSEHISMSDKRIDPNAHYMRLAHVAIKKRIPTKNDVIDGTLDNVEIWFTSSVNRKKSSIAVIGPDKQRADDEQVKHNALDPGHISVGIKDLRDGQYKVRYRALALDGHLVSGSYIFTVKRAAQKSVLN